MEQVFANAFSEETIAAIATPAGEGGIGIIRLSGPKAPEILGAVFRAPAGGQKLPEPRTMTYGFVSDPADGTLIDEVLAVYMPAPKTYTKEDVVEIHCHGGRVPLTRALELVLRQGARLAEPGEFTKRAFLNGRIDLSQAEAVMDLIDARTTEAAAAALDQLRGRFSEEIGALRQKVTDILVDLAVNIDYPDEDIEEVTYRDLIARLKAVKDDIADLLSGAEAGRILKEGLAVAIIGAPNVGKSSLMNRLLRESRAIVTEIPGTTRDTIEEFANLKGVPIRLIDTAGIRETGDLVERIGIDRSRKSMEEADLIIAMLDISASDPAQTEILEGLDRRKMLVLFNKTDRGPALSEAEMERIADGAPYLVTSMLDRASIDRVEEKIRDFALAEGELGSRRNSRIVTSVRHKAMLEEAASSLEDAVRAAESGAPLEIVDIDVENVYRALGFITGDSVQSDVIDEVFSRFCLGK